MYIRFDINVHKNTHWKNMIKKSGKIARTSILRNVIENYLPLCVINIQRDQFDVVLYQYNPFFVEYCMLITLR